MKEASPGDHATPTPIDKRPVSRRFTGDIHVKERDLARYHSEGKEEVVQQDLFDCGKLCEHRSGTSNSYPTVVGRLVTKSHDCECIYTKA